MQTHVCSNVKCLVRNKTLLLIRLTHAVCPTPLHCWGKPPSSGLGSVETLQSLVAVLPALESSSSLPQPPAEWIC